MRSSPPLPPSARALTALAVMFVIVVGGVLHLDLSIGLKGEGISGGEPMPRVLQGEVRRSLVLEMVAQVDVLGHGAEQVEATARVLPGRAAGRIPVLPDRCERRSPEAGGLRPVDRFLLQISDELSLEWDPSRSLYAGARTADLDLGWQPVAARTEGGDGAWSLSLPGALQFGDRLTVQAVSLLPDGGWRVEWEGPYVPADVELRVTDGASDWRCGVGGPSVEIPWWLVERPGAVVSLAATRSKVQFLPDHTAVEARASLLFPVTVGEVRADQLDILLPGAPDPRLDRTGLPRSWWYHSGQRWRDLIAT